MFGLENIYFSDCLLRNRDEFRYLLHLDPDELPMLGRYDSVQNFIISITSKYQKHPTNFRLFWKTFHNDTPPGEAVKDVPSQFFFLRHDTYRRECVKEACGKFKTLYDTRHTIAAYSHKALICKGPCRRVQVSSKKAYIAHYRRDCSGAPCKDPTSFSAETFLHAFKHKVVQAVNEALLLIHLN
ncbi:Glycosyltransferase family 92 [Trinorchestia longiramus]|nr:Glycosyltransferase family 92 [Trinorchestia longiramus]